MNLSFVIMVSFAAFVAALPLESYKFPLIDDVDDLLVPTVSSTDFE